MPTAIADLSIHRDKEGVPFEVRDLLPGDRPELERFYDAFEPKRGAQGLPPDGAERVRRWLDSLVAAQVQLIAFRGGELIAHAFVVPTGRDGVGEYAVFIREDLRGRGVGTEVHRIAIDTARRVGLRGLWLTVEPRNRAAIRSYEKVGFRFKPETLFSVEAEMELDLTQE